MELIVDISKKLKDFTLKINFAAGRDTLGVLGASGSGKSMTLRCIAGLVHPDQGRIVLNGRVLSIRQIVNISVQPEEWDCYFRTMLLFPKPDVKRNIAFGLKDNGRNEQKEKSKSSLEILAYGPPGSKASPIREGAARTEPWPDMVYRTDCLLLDEPFSALETYPQRPEKELKNLLSAYNRGPPNVM
jgi:ABC-type sulfate/molybdate transport systems ATPase subunit